MMLSAAFAFYFPSPYVCPIALIIGGTFTAFNYKDYADNNRNKQMTLSCREFIRRFEQHILPYRFTKIRTYGYLANRSRTTRINEVLKQMKLPLHKGKVEVPLQVVMLVQFGINITECPCCKNKTMQLVEVFYPYRRTDDG